MVERVLTFLNAAKRLAVRVQILVTGRITLKEIETYLNISIDHAVLKARYDNPGQCGAKTQMNRLEKCLLKRADSPIAKELAKDDKGKGDECGSTPL